MRRRGQLLALLAALCLPAAAWPQGAAPKKDTKAGEKAAEPANPAAAQAKAANEDPDFIIGAEDVLNINVWKENDISRTVPVRPDGKISLPLLNDVQAAGLTPQQLAASIREGLKKYMSEPEVTVIVSAVNSRRVYVMGEVSHPGVVPLLHGMTVLQALASSGSFTQFANIKGIYLLRNENGKQVKYPFNYKAVVKGQNPEQNLELKPGDTIVVP
ncbi:MAG TPA: polysaccharide biosynthesis/export family protein [Candidatus Acidoferrales bacterium]|nr:polysaccharide biosynthesis/export family protein [Candidatus Acidoferrales bacterium]